MGQEKVHGKICSPIKFASAVETYQIDVPPQSQESNQKKVHVFTAALPVESNIPLILSASCVEPQLRKWIPTYN